MRRADFRAGANASKRVDKDLVERRGLELEAGDLELGSEKTNDRGHGGGRLRLGGEAQLGVVAEIDNLGDAGRLPQQVAAAAAFDTERRGAGRGADRVQA